MRRLLAIATAAVLGASADAGASIWVASGARSPQLRVDARGFAEVAWRDARGVRRTVLVPPTGRLLPGGRLSGRDVSRPAALALPMKVVVRRTPDGRLWALQRWRVQPGRPEELHFSRWRGAPTHVDAGTVCCTGDRPRIEGRVTFAGRPVFGSSPTPEGKRIRLIAYVDCFLCTVNDAGWGRMLGVFLRPPDGSFSLVVRTPWAADRYRVTVAGPNRGATLAPDARTEIR
jgi:hypothetical protein